MAICPSMMSSCPTGTWMLLTLTLTLASDAGGPRLRSSSRGGRVDHRHYPLRHVCRSSSRRRSVISTPPSSIIGRSPITLPPCGDGSAKLIPLLHAYAHHHCRLGPTIQATPAAVVTPTTDATDATLGILPLLRDEPRWLVQLCPRPRPLMLPGIWRIVITYYAQNSICHLSPTNVPHGGS